MKDVATLAGVSVGTVSNVLNSPERVSESKRRRVEDAITKLGYVRNESARQLRVGRSRAIGLVVLDLSNPFFTDLARGAEEYVLSRGFTVQIGNSAQDREREQAQLDLFVQQQVRGILFAPIRDIGEQVAQIRRRGIPLVFVDHAGDMSYSCAVSVDDIEGGRLAVEHLLELGHRAVAFVGGPSALRQVRDRRIGAQLALTGHDANLLVVSTRSLDVASGIQAAGEIAALPDGERPTGVFAGNDLVAIGLLQGFVTHGFRVPEDIAIIGYDDIAFAAAAAVPLSSIRQPRELLGRMGAELLFTELDALDNELPHEHRHEIFTPELVARRSTLGEQRGRTEMSLHSRAG
jgi:LacI family transcriptional regulator